jgi:HlyD family secretion protein
MRNELQSYYKAGFRKLTLLSVIVLTTCLGGSALWVFTASVGGAVIAPGAIVVKGSVKEIQHSDGGYVEQILVREGDQVQAGQALLQLDTTSTKAELAIINDQLNSLIVTEARLIAETSGETTLAIASQDMALVEPDQKFDKLVASQGQLLSSRLSGIDNQLKQLNEQTLQNRQEVKGLTAQYEATEKEMTLVSVEIQNLEKLREQGFTADTPITQLRRQIAQIEGTRGALRSQIARAKLSISEREITAMRVVDEAQRQALEQLERVQREKARLIQTKLTVVDRLRRLTIRTAQPGIVHDLQVFTVNGVIRPGEVLMRIVPQQDDLVIEARVQTTDIDQIFPGQDASLMFTSFNARTTPQVNGHVQRVSPDANIDSTTGNAFYRVHLKVDEDQLPRLGNNEIVPGMPVDAFIKTGERTVANYMIQPIVDHMARAFREE